MHLLLIPLAISILLLGLAVGVLIENKRLNSQRTHRELEELRAQTRTTLVNLIRVEARLETVQLKLDTSELEDPDVTQDLRV